MDFVDQSGNMYLIVFCEAFKDETNDFANDAELIEYMFNRDKSLTMTDKMIKQAIQDIDKYDKSLTKITSTYAECRRRRSELLKKLFKSPNKQSSKKHGAITSYNKSGNMALQTPIYPFPIDFAGYDFTINVLHISLYDILLNNTFVYNKNVKNSQETNNQIEFIDFNWHTKVYNFNVKDITNKCHVFDFEETKMAKVDNNSNKNKNKDDKNWDQVHSEMNLIADYNYLALQHLDSKFITMPCLDALNVATAPFYFWRFVKLCEKLIDKLYANLWYIDSEYLDWTIYFYYFWFLDPHGEYTNITTLKKTFIRKLLKWHVNIGGDSKTSTNTNTYYKRFKVFRYIYFEDYFKHKLAKDSEFRQEFESWVIRSRLIDEKEKKDIQECFQVCFDCLYF